MGYRTELILLQTRMQVLPSLAGASASTSSASAAAAAATSAGSATATASATRPVASAALTTFSQHLRSVSTGEGVRTLWRGVASVIMGAGPAHAAHFGMYEFVREVAGGRGEGWQGVLGTAVAGAAGTITSDALMNPFDGTLLVAGCVLVGCGRGRAWGEMSLRGLYGGFGCAQWHQKDEQVGIHQEV